MSKKPTPYVQPEIFSNPDLVDRIFEYILAEIPELHERCVALKPQVRAEFNGERCYISTSTPTERQQLVQQVLAIFDGRNASEVARRLKISRATVYRIIKQPGGVKKLSQLC